MAIDSAPQGGEVMHEADEPAYPQPVSRTGEGERPSADADRDKGDAPEASARTNPVTGAGDDIAG